MSDDSKNKRSFKALQTPREVIANGNEWIRKCVRALTQTYGRYFDRQTEDIWIENFSKFSMDQIGIAFNAALREEEFPNLHRVLELIPPKTGHPVAILTDGTPDAEKNLTRIKKLVSAIDEGKTTEELSKVFGEEPESI